MKRSITIRRSLHSALKGAVGCVLVGGFASGMAWAECGHGARQQGAPIVRVAPSSQPMQPQPMQQPSQSRSNGYNGAAQPYTSPAHINPDQQHLAQWMSTHRNLTLGEQQRALAAEPGYRQLQPAEQQRIQNRLMQLNSMGPGQRERALARTEAMERLAPAQRQQVRSALSDLGGLPEEQRKAVARTFRAFRGMPVGQQQAYLNSPEVRAQFSERERYVLGNLFAAGPYLPPPVAGPR